MVYLSTSNYYEELQVSPRAEPSLIDAAFRCLVRTYHPDVNPAADATARMQRITEAYRILRDPESRAAYDSELMAAFSPRHAAYSMPRGRTRGLRQRVLQRTD